MWIKEFNSYFCKIENLAYGETNEQSFSNPHLMGLFHHWESELTFGNLTNLWRLANQKVSKIVSQKVSSLLGLAVEG